MVSGQAGVDYMAAIMFFEDHDLKVTTDELILTHIPSNAHVVVTDLTDGVYTEFANNDIDGNVVKGKFNPSHCYFACYYWNNPEARAVHTPIIDHVDHPNHYQTEKGIEVIDVIEAFTENLHGVVAFDIGCAMKYICRWSKKNGTEDLRKAIWYIEHAIETTEGSEDGSIYRGKDNG